MPTTGERYIPNGVATGYRDYWGEEIYPDGWRRLRVKGGVTYHPPETWFKRPPRKREYAPAYWGHAVQGFLAGLLMPSPVLGWAAHKTFLKYQVLENTVYRHWRDAWYAGEAPTPDCASRDVADHLIGLWAAVPFSIAKDAGLVWLALNLAGAA